MTSSYDTKLKLVVRIINPIAAILAALIIPGCAYTMNFWQMFGGLGMIIMVVGLGINLIMYFNSYTRNQKNTVIIIATFNLVAFMAFTGIWVVGTWMSKQP